MSSEHTFCGVYRGVCFDNADPENKNRIKVQVPQILGESSTDWAWPITPVTNTANHLDHLPHLASEVAALLSNHTFTVSGTTGSGGAPSHSHAVSFPQTITHSGKSGTKLTHDHEISTDPLEKDGSEDGNPAAEHTYHRSIPEVGSGVWVMFEGGDPNFPVWLGVF